MLDKEIITIFNEETEKIEKYKNYLYFLKQDKFKKITLILSNGIPDNISGPAITIEYENEFIKSWIRNGLYHRNYGPAIEYKINKQYNKWIINGLLINYNSIKKWLLENNIEEDYTKWTVYDKSKFLIKWISP